MTRQMFVPDELNILLTRVARSYWRSWRCIEKNETNFEKRRGTPSPLDSSTVYRYTCCRTIMTHRVTRQYYSEFSRKRSSVPWRWPTRCKIIALHGKNDGIQNPLMNGPCAESKHTFFIRRPSVPKPNSIIVALYHVSSRDWVACVRRAVKQRFWYGIHGSRSPTIWGYFGFLIYTRASWTALFLCCT